MAFVTGRCDRDAIHYGSVIGVIKSRENNFTTIKDIHNEFANLIDRIKVDFDNNDWWFFQETVSVIGMESVVTRPYLRYIRDYLTPGICSLIKLVPMETINVISRQNQHNNIIILIYALI